MLKTPHESIEDHAAYPSQWEPVRFVEPSSSRLRPRQFRPGGSEWSMPIVYAACLAVNPKEYLSIIKSLKPADSPCIFCDSPVTHGHGWYRRVPLDLPEGMHIHRRYCPVCGRTFGLLPSFLAPYQRATIPTQDEACTQLAEGKSYEQVLDNLDARGLPLFEVTTLRRWFARLAAQVREILPALSALAQRAAPLARLPQLRKGVRDAMVLTFYERLAMWKRTPADSGAWNLLRSMVCLFAPPLSGNRVSYGLTNAPPV